MTFSVQFRHAAVGLAAALALGCPSENTDPKEAASVAESQGEHARRLLQQYAEILAQVAKAGRVEIPRELLMELQAEARTAHERKQIGDPFHARFARLVDITVGVLEPQVDAAKLERDVAALAESTGKPEPTSMTLADLSGLMVEEVVRLHLLTDPAADPKTVRQTYFPHP